MPASNSPPPWRIIATGATKTAGSRGRKLRFVWKDFGYKTDQSVAVFRKISASDNPPFYYGDFDRLVESGRGRCVGPGHHAHLGPVVQLRPRRPGEGPLLLHVRADLHRHARGTAPVYQDQPEGFDGSVRGPDLQRYRVRNADPIAAAKAKAQELGLPLAAEIITKPGGVDVSAEVIKLRRAKPDYVIFHGYVLAPIPEFMRQIREAGLDPTFMGTIWTMDKLIIDQMKDAADGFTGVMPYRYYYDTDGAPAMKTIQAVNRKATPDSTYRTVFYVHSWLTMMIYEEIAKRLIAAGKPFDGPNMKAALEGIENWDTGGIIGLPVCSRMTRSRSDASIARTARPSSSIRFRNG